MKRHHIFFLVFGFLCGLIVISTVVAQISEKNRLFISGDDCLRAHSSIYILDTPALHYGGYAQINESLNFSIKYEVSVPGMVFSASSYVELENSSIYLLSEVNFQEKIFQDDEIFEPKWNIGGSTNGSFVFNVITQLNVRYRLSHPRYAAVYNYTHTASFTVQEGALDGPYLKDPNSTEPGHEEDRVYSKEKPKLYFGQLLGFISIITGYIVIQLGLPERRKYLRTKYGWTAAQLRNVHCNWGYISIASISLHLILLSQTLKWGNYFRWFTFFPQFLGIEDFSTMMLGLDLAGWSFTIFIIATIFGALFKQIAKKLGYKTALFSQQITYFAFLFALLHAIFNGSWTRKYIVLLILQCTIVADVTINRIKTIIKRKQKKIKIADNDSLTQSGDKS